MKKFIITCFALIAFGLGNIAVASSAISDISSTNDYSVELMIKDKKPKKKKKKKSDKKEACETTAKPSCCSHAKSGCAGSSKK